MTFLTWLNSTRYTVFIKLTDSVWCNNVHLWWWLTKIIFKQKSSITQVRKAELSHPISDLYLQQGNFSWLIRKDLILFVSYQSVCIFGKTDMRENLVGFISLYNQWNTGSVPTVLTTHADNHPPTHHTTLSQTHTHGHTIKADAASSPYQQTDRKMRENFSFSVFATKHEHSEKQIQEADKVWWDENPKWGQKCWD